MSMTGAQEPLYFPLDSFFHENLIAYSIDIRRFHPSIAVHCPLITKQYYLIGFTLDRILPTFWTRNPFNTLFSFATFGAMTRCTIRGPERRKSRLPLIAFFSLASGYTHLPRPSLRSNFTQRADWLLLWTASGCSLYVCDHILHCNEAAQCQDTDNLLAK